MALVIDQDENISEIMVNKYFESVLLPYYLIKKDLSRKHLKKLGFNPFLIRISRNNYHLSKIKDNFIDTKKDDLIKLFGKEQALKKLERAKIKIENLIKMENLEEIKFFSDIKEYVDKIKDVDKLTLSNKQKFKYMLSRMYNYDCQFYESLENNNLTFFEICQEFLKYFIKCRFKQKYIAKIIDIDKRNLYEVFKKFLQINFHHAKLEYFSRAIIIEHYKNGLMAFEMISIIKKKFNETDILFGLSKNTIREHIKEIFKEEYDNFDKNFAMLDLYLKYRFYNNIMKTKYELKYEILLNSITKDDYTGINYLSFETRIIRYIQMFGFSVYDGYDLHGHLIEGGKASFHHLDFKKINDNIHNFIFLPDKPRKIMVNYIYHHHPIVRTREFYDLTLYNMNLLEKICKENDISHVYLLKNWSTESIELLKYRILNDNWIKEIYMFLPRGNYPYKLKNRTLEHFFKQFVHQNSYYRLKIIKTDFKKFWGEYLVYRKELRESSILKETEDIQSLSLNNNENQNNSTICKKKIK